MIDENNGCITKSKLTIIVKTLSNIMTGAGQQPNKQINILRDTETGNIQVENILQEEKYILTNRCTSRLTVDTRRQRVKQIMKNEAPYVLLLLK